MKTTTRFTILAVLAILAGTLPLAAQELVLSAELESPLVLAGSSQTNYMKIGLRGFEWARTGQRPPLNLALVLDRSGSMEGEKLERAKEAARYAVSLLDSRDIISIVTYESEVQVLVPATRATDKRALNRLIDQIEVDGSTALFAGVSRGAAELRKFLAREQVNRVVLISDGLANVGPSSPGELGDLGSSLRREGISVTTIGLGLGFNEDLMTRLAQTSDGNHAFVQEPRDLVKIFDAEFKDALSVVARDVTIRIRCADGIRPLRIMNREGDIRGQEITLSLNQVYSLQEKYFLVEVEVPAMAVGTSRSVASVSVEYFNLKSKASNRLSAASTVKATASVSEKTKARSKDVAEAVAIQKNVEAGEKAIELRDMGKVEEAKAILNQNALELDSLSRELASPALQAAGTEAKKDAEEIVDDSAWQAQRKSMKASQFSAENQQSFTSP